MSGIQRGEKKCTANTTTLELRAAPTICDPNQGPIYNALLELDIAHQ